MVKGTALFSLLPSSLHSEALAAPTLLDALQIIKKKSELYATNENVKDVIDGKIQEINDLIQKFDVIKQQLILYYPDYVSALSELEYTDSRLPLPYADADPAYEICYTAGILQSWVNGEEPDAAWGHINEVWSVSHYYRRFATAALSFDSDFLRGVKMPLTSEGQRAWDVVHQARELPYYSDFYNYYYGKITLEEFLKVFFPDLEVEFDEYGQIDGELYRELTEQIPHFEQYMNLIPEVRYIESLTDGMNETSGAALIGADIDVSKNIDSIASLVAEIDGGAVDGSSSEVSTVPAVPNTGSEGMELAGTVGKIALTGVASLCVLISTYSTKATEGETVVTTNAA